jgi:hypothetical protein
VIRAPALVRLTAPRSLAIRPGCREPGMAGHREQRKTWQPGRSPAGCGRGQMGSLPRAPCLAGWPLARTWPGTRAQRPGRCPGGQLSRLSCHAGAWAPGSPASSSGSPVPDRTRRRWHGWQGQSRPAASAAGAASARLRAGAARLRRLQLLPGQRRPGGGAVAGAAEQQAHQARVKAADRAGTDHEHRVVPASADRGAQRRRCRGAAAGRPCALAGVDGRCRPPRWRADSAMAWRWRVNAGGLASGPA